MGFFSKTWKKVVKTFNKVADTVSKVAPVILAASAVFFTVGNAVAPDKFWSWDQASAELIGSLGFQENSLLSDTLVEAVTYAGYGAAAGAGTAAIGGGDPLTGAQVGTVVGGVGGGIYGASTSTGTFRNPLTPGTGLAEADPAQEIALFGRQNKIGPVVNDGEGDYIPGPDAVAPATETGEPASKLEKFWKGLNDNSGLVGPILKGATTAALAGDASDGRAEAARLNRESALEIQKQDQDNTRSNYDTANAGLLGGRLPILRPNPTVAGLGSNRDAPKTSSLASSVQRPTGRVTKGIV